MLAEGWKREPLARVEVHRRSVSPEFLCASDRYVFAIVTDEPAPRPLPTFDPADATGLSAFLCDRFGLSGGKPGGGSACG